MRVQCARGEAEGRKSRRRRTVWAAHEVSGWKEPLSVVARENEDRSRPGHAGLSGGGAVRQAGDRLHGLQVDDDGHGRGVRPAHGRGLQPHRAGRVRAVGQLRVVTRIGGERVVRTRSKRVRPASGDVRTRSDGLRRGTRRRRFDKARTREQREGSDHVSAGPAGRWPTINQGPYRMLFSKSLMWGSKTHRVCPKSHVRCDPRTRRATPLIRPTPQTKGICLADFWTGTTRFRRGRRPRGGGELALSEAARGHYPYVRPATRDGCDRRRRLSAPVLPRGREA